MFDPDDLVRGVLTGVLGGRRKRSRKATRYLTGGLGSVLSNPQAFLTVAGVAWGIFETMQNQGSSATGPGTGLGSSSTAHTPAPPLPVVPGAQEVPADALRVVRLAIAAASADGTLTDADRTKIVEQARASGAEHLVEQELQNRRPLAEIVAGVSDPAQRATLYVLAFGIIRADESVSGSERIFLAQLANQLGLHPADVSNLEAKAAARIDAQE